MKRFSIPLVVPGMGQLYTGAKRGYVYIAAEVGNCSLLFLLKTTPQILAKIIAISVRQHVIFDGPGSFEDWDPIEDLNTPRSMKIGIMSTIPRRLASGQVNGTGTMRDPLKTRRMWTLSLIRHIGWRLSIYGRKQTTPFTRPDSLRRGNLKPCYQCGRGTHYKPNVSTRVCKTRRCKQRRRHLR